MLHQVNHATGRTFSLLAMGLVVIAAGLFADRAVAQPGDAQPPRVAAEVIADREAAVPGDTLTVGVRMTMRPGWHTYWRNPGDSGQPTSIDITGVEGLAVGPIRWPLPKRYEMAGGLTNIGYGGTVILSRIVTLPDDLGDAGELTLTLDVNWLVCDDSVCVPGGQELTLTLPLADAAGPAHEDAFAEHAASLPVELDDLADQILGVAVETAREGAKVAWDLRVDWQGDAPADVEWYPDTDPSLMIDEAEISSDGDQTRVRQTASKLAGIKPGTDTLVMLLVWEEVDGTRRGVRLPAPLPAEAGPDAEAVRLTPADADAD